MTTRRFTQHYTVAEARAVLPQVRGWLMELRQLGPALEKAVRCYGGDVSRLCDVVRQVALVRGLISESMRAPFSFVFLS